MNKIFGQWIGNISGENDGYIVLNLEERNGFYKGRVFLRDNNDLNPNLLAQINLSVIGTDVKGDLSDFRIIHAPSNMYVYDLEKAKELYPGIDFPSDGDFKGAILESNQLAGEWSTNVNTKGDFNARLSDINKPTSLESVANNWIDYKNLISDHKDFIFRGQEDSWRLSTTFHRTGRSDLIAYSIHDIPQLHRYLSSLPGHLFRLDDASEYGAFLSLAQHHGYPTPLLDWTESPYVAAYFAYANIPKNQHDGHVYIYMFDKDNWINDLNLTNMATLDMPNLTLSVLQPLAIGNVRMLPQQSVTTFSNVADIESFINFFEDIHNKSYLKLAKLPINEREIVMRELDQMGITAASLFPGLDGICKHLKERQF
jgi:hypothetical protein